MSVNIKTYSPPRNSGKFSVLIEHNTNEKLTLLPFSIGPHRFAIEAPFIHSIGGRELTILNEQGLPNHVLHFPLDQELEAPPPSAQEFIIARGGPGRERVLFTVDGTERLIHVPLHNIRPLPPITHENIKVRFMWGVAVIDQDILILLDPELLYQLALSRAKQREE